MRSSCFLAPVHPPKFHFAERLLKSYAEHFVLRDVFLVFTNENEHQQFKETYPDLQYQSIVCDDSILNHQNIINVKKFFGVKWLFDNTQYTRVGVIDVDSIFFRFMDYDTIFAEYLLNRKIYGHTVSKDAFMANNIESCVRFFDPKYRGFLEKETRNFSTFFWFNDIPVYEKTSFEQFIDEVKLVENYPNIIWHDFDYIFYAYFLMIKGYMNLEVLDYHVPFGDGSFIELQKRIPVDIFREHYNIMNPMWIVDPIDESDMRNTFMLVHVDR